LVAALPIAAFAEDVSPCVGDICNHIYRVYDTEIYESDGPLRHKVTPYRYKTCIVFGKPGDTEISDSYFDMHDFDYDPIIGKKHCRYCEYVN
jgi:hypothetical protein